MAVPIMCEGNSSGMIWLALLTPMMRPGLCWGILTARVQIAKGKGELQSPKQGEAEL